MAKKMALVNAKQYWRRKNVLFMMAPDDDRLGTENWELIEMGTYTCSMSVRTLATLSGKRYEVFEDWSVRLWPEFKPRRAV
jgi:hypothetical protein